MSEQLDRFAPFYSSPEWSKEAKWALTPFVTSLEAPIFSFRSVLPPQVLGALFSRASRAEGDLREVFWNEYLKPILYPEDDSPENLDDAKELREVIAFCHDHPTPPYNTKRAHRFFAKWLSQYGDDSIAQLASTNLVVVGLSQIAIKFIEDQRIGISAIEKSTRYVDYGAKVNGGYMYYTDPRLEQWGLLEEYSEVMDGLFETYAEHIPLLTERLARGYPDEKQGVLEKKAFDVLRGFLPMATLSQVAFHANAQAFKYMIDRCVNHPRGELRWFAEQARIALNEEIPALLLRLDDERNNRYQRELANRRVRMEELVDNRLNGIVRGRPYRKPYVRLIEHDPDGEDKVIAALLFGSSDLPWGTIAEHVAGLDDKEKQNILSTHLSGRTERWHKVGRAFENAFVRFEILVNAGAYRDLHRHRMHTQERQRFTTNYGYEIPDEIRDFGLKDVLQHHMRRVRALYVKIAKHDLDAAQDVVTLFHFVRFYQHQNFRQIFWEIELRTIEQGHPDYRRIEQEKFRLLAEVYPLITPYVRVDMNEYGLARRGDENRSKRKEDNLTRKS